MTKRKKSNRLMERSGEMKQGKKPTLAQRRIMEQEGLASRDWLVTKDTVGFMAVVHREQGTTKKIDK